MKAITHKLNEKVWLYPGDAAWHFIIIKKEDALEIKMDYIWPRRGFGAIPVNVTIGKTSWKTSIFPEKTGTYLLPLKKEARKKENIKEGDSISFTLEVVN